MTGLCCPTDKDKLHLLENISEFFSLPYPLDSSPIFYFIFSVKIFVAFLALIHQCAMGPSAVKRDALTVPLCFIVKCTLRLQCLSTESVNADPDGKRKVGCH